MRRDLVFLILFAVIVIAFLLFFVQTGPSPEPPGGTTATGTTGAASGTSSSEPPLRITRTDGSVWDPDSEESKALLEREKKGIGKKDEKPKPVEREDAPAPAGLDHVIEEVKFDDVELGDVFDALAAESGLKFHAPEHLLRGEEAKVTLTASRISVRSVIELIVLTKGLTWESRPDGTIHIADGE